ncbi:Uncharacterised protein [Vibrio cholerae]|uniref:Uncharacterized protein n=1 Tax=Vibrio cholerae TaxID=666 RepID=A0A655YVF0_VIBCL|nr:Uncharacterised protein [Vibrio cholerae]CSC08546.1 Uncharacterised protein [Vibrio cholerae]CSC50233.1 Uncharacterised protein [Vibrio cholerae]CSC59696.1 Uncharacterised protein [Vibrio cholerae]CSD06985.1 Uncharacterised protein [Vibrio cholerae]
MRDDGSLDHQNKLAQTEQDSALQTSPLIDLRLAACDGFVPLGQDAVNRNHHIAHNAHKKVQHAQRWVSTL